MTEPEFKAYTIALELFKEKEKGAYLKNFDVKVRDHSDAYEVIFIPKQVATENREGTVTLSLGGKTAYGREVHYLISKIGYKVIRTSFAR